MLRKILLLGLSFVSISFLAHPSFAKTADTKPSTNQKLPAPCQQMFRTADRLILDAEKQPGTHTQVSRMKNKLNSSKAEILKMEPTMQEKSCNKGLTTLNTLKQKH